jgi:hypothetical protein
MKTGKYFATLSALEMGLGQLSADKNVKAVMVFAADKQRPDSESFEKALKAFHKPMIGGIFPEIIAEGQRQEKGFLLFPMNVHISTAIIQFKDDKEKLEEILDEALVGSQHTFASLITFIDAFAPAKGSFISDLYNYFGPILNYFGGGAGSLSFKPFQCIIHNGKLYQNAAAIALLEKQLNMGVAHGWTAISKPLKVTKTIGNSIVSIDWKPAFDVYKEIIKQHSQQEIDEQNFFSIAKSYPLGLVKLDDEMIIRDPYAAHGNLLHIVDEVPQDEYVCVMNGNLDSLLSGASHAYKAASETLEQNNTVAFCIDCISRVLYMGDSFVNELDIINKDGAMNGILSIGEIANPGHVFLEIFNKTIVVAKWKSEH